MSVEAEDLVQELLAEAVHHGHHDDQRRDAEHDAEERKAGDDGNKAFLATRPQIASGQQPFEGSKRRGSGDRKSTRLNSSHTVISYAVFCLKKKKKNKTQRILV